LYIISFDLTLFNCNVHVLYKRIFGNELGFILETSLVLGGSFVCLLSFFAYFQSN
jgi:hypothetical protein